MFQSKLYRLKSHSLPRYWLYFYFISFLLCLGLFLSHHTVTFRTVASTSSSQRLQLLIPLLTVPLSHCLYYFMAWFLVSSWHELGHFMTALMLDMPVHGFSLHFLGWYPVAMATHVECKSVASHWKKSLVYSSGLIQNVYLYLLLGLWIPSESISFSYQWKCKSTSLTSFIMNHDRLIQLNGYHLEKFQLPFYSMKKVEKEIINQCLNEPPLGFCVNDDSTTSIWKGALWTCRLDRDCPVSFHCRLPLVNEINLTVERNQDFYSLFLDRSYLNALEWETEAAPFWSLILSQFLLYSLILIISFSSYLNWMNISVLMVNCLPFPPLDGYALLEVWVTSMKARRIMMQFTVISLVLGLFYFSVI